MKEIDSPEISNNVILRSQTTRGRERNEFPISGQPVIPKVRVSACSRIESINLSGIYHVRKKKTERDFSLRVGHEFQPVS